MDDVKRNSLRAFLQESLIDAGDHDHFADDSSLFASGRLDSLAMTKLVMFLEDAFQINFADVDFDIELVDSVNDIQALVETACAR